MIWRSGRSRSRFWTIILIFPFYVRCTRFIKDCVAFSVPLLTPTFLILLKFAVLSVDILFSSKELIVVTHGCLIVVGVLTAFWFTFLPKWTTWALHIVMALYDFTTVMVPYGPLRPLVELAISLDEDIPALVYKARPIEYRAGVETRICRERRDIDASPVAPTTEPPLLEMRLVIKGQRELLLVRQPGRERHE